jgi:DNA topoisomerase VI subunit B
MKLPESILTVEGKPMTTLNRAAFETSRLLDFFSERELVAQTGHNTDWWPEMTIKELTDNSIDAMEQVGTSPTVEITVTDESITVTDAGPGIPESTLQATLDYSVRVSTNSKYISPARGSQGNALKCILALPYVISAGEIGRIDVSTGGKGYEMTVKTDPIQQKTVVDVNNGTPPKVKNGTSVRVHWPDSSSYN